MFFSDSSLIKGGAVDEPQVHGIKPSTANVDEEVIIKVTEDQSASEALKKDRVHSEGTATASTRAEHIEVVKPTITNSVSLYSSSPSIDSPSGKVNDSRSIFSFTSSAPVTKDADMQPTNASSSDGSGGVVMKPVSLFLQQRNSPDWKTTRNSSMAVEPLLSFELAKKESFSTSTSSYPHHAHHLHHRPFHLHQYSNHPSAAAPQTKDVTVSLLSSSSSLSSVGVGSMIQSSTNKVVHEVKADLEGSHSLPFLPTISKQIMPNAMSSTPLSNTVDVQNNSKVSTVVDPEMESNTMTTSSDSYIKDIP